MKRFLLAQMAGGFCGGLITNELFADCTHTLRAWSMIIFWYPIGVTASVYCSRRWFKRKRRFWSIFLGSYVGVVVGVWLAFDALILFWKMSLHLPPSRFMPFGPLYYVPLIPPPIFAVVISDSARHESSARR